jgi:hypothetical protein
LGKNTKGDFKMVEVCPQAQRWPWLSAAAVHIYLAMAHKSKLTRKVDKLAKSELTEETQGPKIENLGAKPDPRFKGKWTQMGHEVLNWGKKMHEGFKYTVRDSNELIHGRVFCHSTVSSFKSIIIEREATGPLQGSQVAMGFV